VARSEKARVVADALVAKGMTPSESAHHHMFTRTMDGVTTLITRMSRDSREINDTLASLMGKQCCLQLREFWQLVDCPLSETAWEQLIRERCADGRNPFISR
jgi:hypothetical protein